MPLLDAKKARKYVTSIGNIKPVENSNSSAVTADEFFITNQIELII